MTEATWVQLTDELDAWQADGRVASLWWRDDDAVTSTVALDRLLDASTASDVPLCLAVIPAGARPALARRVVERPLATVLQHGYAHRSHAPAGEKAAELGPHRDRSTMLEELRDGRRRLDALFGPRFLPVLVPPWNRIDTGLVAMLADAGITGLSTFTPRVGPVAAPGIIQVNSHVDIIDWRGSRGFRGIAGCVGSLVGHLAARRRGTVDVAEPTGLLTHHLDHDTGCTAFVAELLTRTGSHPAARWLSAHEVFGE